MSLLKKKAFVDYEGEDADECSSKRLHRNTIRKMEPYYKTQVFVKKKTKQLLSQNYKRREILEQVRNVSRPLEGARNAKYVTYVRSTMKGDKMLNGNTSDQIWAIVNKLQNEKGVYVRKVITDESSLPCLVLYTDWQMKLVKNFCVLKSKFSSVMEVDRTYNIGDYFVNPSGILLKNVRRKKTGERVIIMGPVYICWNAELDTFASWMHTMRMQLRDNKKGDAMLLFGSDSEHAIRGAAEMCLPNGLHFYCCLHMKDNIKRKLDHLPTSERNVIIEQIFGDHGWGPNGLTSSKSMPEFWEKKKDIDSSKFPDGYFDIVMKKIEKNVENRLKSMGAVEANFHTNHVESMNNMIKMNTEHKKQTLPGIVDVLFSITNGHEAELQQILHDGPGELYQDGPNAKPIPVGVWSQMDKSSQTKAWDSWLKGPYVPRLKKGYTEDGKIVAANGLWTATDPGDTKRKPNQNNRSAANRGRQKTPRRLPRGQPKV